MVALSVPTRCIIPSTSHENVYQETTILTKLKSCKSIIQLKQVHALIIKSKKTSPSTNLICTKILSFPKEMINDSIDYCYSLINQCQNPDTHVFNSIINAISTSKNNNSMKSLDFYELMMLKGVFPDNYTIPFVIKSCTQSKALWVGQQIHGQSVKIGLVSNVYVNNTLMRLYAVCGVLDAVCKLFDKSTQRDLITWTTLIQGYVDIGFYREGVDAFSRMCQCNVVADGMTLVVVISACAKLGDFGMGKKIHEYMIHHGISINSDVFLGNALVDMYLKCGEVGFACRVFDEMPVKNVVSWNSVISGLAQQGQFREALEMFREMQDRGLKPDDVTLVAVLNSCANLGALELGRWVHAYVDKNGVKADGFISNALVDMYAKCGCIGQAFCVFQAMRNKDVYSYTAMIVGFAMHGEAERALNLFSEMSLTGTKPDEVTFVGVLSACSHAGLVEEGRRHFKDMSSVYKLEPQTEHYGCMVDLLGRAGLVNEAEEFIKTMPIEPDAFIWGSLLGACKIHGKIELGERVMRRLIKLQPERDGDYVLMSNIYSSANRRREALKWRKALENRKIKKTPGCSLIEIDGTVHEFRKGEKSHPETKRLHKMLENIRAHLKHHEDYNCTDNTFHL